MPASHQQLRTLLEAALDLATQSEREQLLANHPDPELAAEARRLLGQHGRVEVLDRGGAAELVSSGQTPELPDKIGPFRIVELLGTGGMGAVYLGVRDDERFRMEAAIKVIRDVYSREQRERFQRERELLARLEHPSIARVLDGGNTEQGYPWMAIERVQGRPLDVFANEEHLSVADRIRLIQRVIEAVQFAHQNLIVHRDLKPANILVQANGCPKLLDFGAAKAIGLAGQTLTAGLAPMTYAYASPEQIRGEPVTTATDVYALGVILYELLTGDRPHRITGDNPLSLLQAITETDAVAPSEWLRQRQAATVMPAIHPRELSGDLDTIVLKALDREPARRYPSAQSLSDDLARYLANQPILARPSTWRYRCAKWIRRNRLSAALAMGVAGILGVSGFWVVHERNRAMEQARVAQATKQFLIETFTAANRWKTGREVTATDLTLRGLEHVATALKDYPEARIEMYEVLGHTLGRASPLAQGARAREFLVAELRQSKPGSPQWLQAEIDLMHAYWFAEMLPETQRQIALLAQDHADALLPWMRVALQSMRLDPPRMQGDYATALQAADTYLPTWLADRVEFPESKRADLEVVRIHVDWVRVEAFEAAGHDQQVRAHALAMLRHANEDISGRPLVRMNYTGFIVRHATGLTELQKQRARKWIGEQFGDEAGFSLWMDLRLLDSALKSGSISEAQVLYDRLNGPLQRLEQESVFELRDLYLLGAELALAQGQPKDAADRWHRALELSRYSDANLVFPHTTPFESHFTRQALAGLAYLDALAGQPESGLKDIAARQEARGDGAWRRTASWLAAIDSAAGKKREARDRLATILDWQAARGADPDSRLDDLFAEFGLRQHPRVDLPDTERRALDSLFAAHLAGAEQARQQLK